MFLRSKIQDIILRERSKAVSRKKELMPDTTSSPPPNPAFTSPNLLVKGCSVRKSSMYSEDAIGPKSMLATIPFFATGNWSSSDSRDCKTKPLFVETAAATTGTESRHHPWHNRSSRAIGLGLVDALSNEETGDVGCRMVVFGSQLKIQTLPGLSNSMSPVSIESPRSIMEFGLQGEGGGRPCRCGVYHYVTRQTTGVIWSTPHHCSLSLSLSLFPTASQLETLILRASEPIHCASRPSRAGECGLLSVCFCSDFLLEPEVLAGKGAPKCLI